MAEDGRPSGRGHPGKGCLGGVIGAALATLQALWYRLTQDPDVYPPEAAEAPRDDLMLIGDTLGYGDDDERLINELWALPAYERKPQP